MFGRDRLTATEFREVMLEFGRDRLTATEFREVMRENRLQFESALRAFSAESRRHVEEMREENRIYRDETRGYFARIDAKTEEILAEGRAGREALFRILDRMDGNGGTAPAG
jgi:hypothetical protein